LNKIKNAFRLQIILDKLKYFDQDNILIAAIDLEFFDDIAILFTRQETVGQASRLEFYSNFQLHKPQLFFQKPRGARLLKK